MTHNDALLNVIFKMDAFMMKSGRDLGLKRDLVDGINAFIGDDKLEALYINNVDQVNIPDVFVMPRYSADFGKFAMYPDITACCPYGYTVEIHNRCFAKYQAEELVAIIVHHILQNVQSSVAKTRFMGAYTEATRGFRDADLLEAFDDISHSEVMYMAYLDICLRPFNVLADEESNVGTDDILRNVGLADAFDSALVKLCGEEAAGSDPDATIASALRQDVKMMKSVFTACLNDDVKHYFNVIRTGLPMLTIQNILKADNSGAVLGFESKPVRKTPVHPSLSENISKADLNEAALMESYLNPKDETELRYQVDKIITDMRYLEHNDERIALLFRIRTLTMRVQKTREKYMKKLEKSPNDANYTHKVEYLDNILSELELLRGQVVKKDVVPHQVGLIVKYPTGYSY